MPSDASRSRACGRALVGDMYRRGCHCRLLGHCRRLGNTARGFGQVIRWIIEPRRRLVAGGQLARAIPVAAGRLLRPDGAAGVSGMDAAAVEGGVVGYVLARGDGGMKVLVTPHAIEAYQKRVIPAGISLLPERCEAEIVAAMRLLRTGEMSSECVLAEATIPFRAVE